MPRSSLSRSYWLIPIGWGLFIGLITALAFATFVLDGPNIENHESAEVSASEANRRAADAMKENNQQFLIVLLACLLVGGLSAPGVVYTIRRNARKRKYKEMESATLADTGSTHLSSTSSVGLNITGVMTGVFSKPLYKALPYRPPNVEFWQPKGIIVEDPFSKTFSFTVESGVYTKQKTPDMFLDFLMERVREGARWEEKIRRLLEEKLNYRLVTFYSEGPIAADGTCAYGWTFIFACEDSQIGCVATVSSEEISLHYGTTIDVMMPWSLDDIDDYGSSIVVCPNPQLFLQALREQVPEVGDIPLHFRYSPYGIVWLHTRNGEAVIELRAQKDHAVVLGVEGFKKKLGDYQWSNEAVFVGTIGNLVDWAQGLSVESSDFPVLLETLDVHTLIHAENTKILQRVGRSLLDAHGVDTVHQLVDRLHTAIDHENDALARMLLFALSYVPTRAALARLQSLRYQIPKRLQNSAEEAFNRQLDANTTIHGSPLDALDFSELQRVMGRGAVYSIGLHTHSGSDIRHNILIPLRKMGLETKRIRIVTSERHREKKRADPNTSIGLKEGTITGAWLLGKEPYDCEALLTVVPTPYLCAVLHLSGKNAEDLLQQIRIKGRATGYGTGEVVKYEEYTFRNLLDELNVQPSSSVLQPKYALPVPSLLHALQMRMTTKMLEGIMRAAAFIRLWNLTQLRAHLENKENDHNVMILLIRAYILVGYHSPGHLQVMDELVASMRYLVDHRLVDAPQLDALMDAEAARLDVLKAYQQEREPKESHMIARVVELFDQLRERLSAPQELQIPDYMQFPITFVRQTPSEDPVRDGAGDKDEKLASIVDSGPVTTDSAAIP